MGEIGYPFVSISQYLKKNLAYIHTQQSEDIHCAGQK